MPAQPTEGLLLLFLPSASAFHVVVFRHNSSTSVLVWMYEYTRATHLGYTLGLTPAYACSLYVRTRAQQQSYHTSLSYFVYVRRPLTLTLRYDPVVQAPGGVARNGVSRT